MTTYNSQSVKYSTRQLGRYTLVKVTLGCPEVWYGKNNNDKFHLRLYIPVEGDGHRRYLHSTLHCPPGVLIFRRTVPSCQSSTPTLRLSEEPISKEPCSKRDKKKKKKVNILPSFLWRDRSKT